jgi:hypothetical protein
VTEGLIINPSVTFSILPSPFLFYRHLFYSTVTFSFYPRSSVDGACQAWNGMRSRKLRMVVASMLSVFPRCILAVAKFLMTFGFTTMTSILGALSSATAKGSE